MTEIPDSVKYKFSPQLLAEIAVAGTPVKVIIQVAAGTVSLASATIASLGGRVEWQSELTNQISLTIDDGQLAALASLGSILQLFHVPRGELLIHRGVPHAGILPLPQALVATGVTLEETTNYIGAPRLWDRGFRGQGVKVGIVDTGVDKDHPMLDQVVVAERDFTGSGLADTVGHGTWVASAIAGREWLSPLGLMIGVAPEATIVSAKAFNTDNADLDVIMQALEWVALQDCHVLSNSWGGEDYPPLLELVRVILRRGQVIVGAIGNAGPSAGTVRFPGGWPEVIGVGSIATIAPAPDAVASFSSRGPAPNGVLKPDLVAPGGSEEECVEGAAPGGGTACFRGTSMAAPHVSGAIALLLSNGEKPIPRVRGIGVAWPDNNSGYGVLSFAPGAVPIPVNGPAAGFDFAPVVGIGFLVLVLLFFISPVTNRRPEPAAAPTDVIQENVDRIIERLRR